MKKIPLTGEQGTEGRKQTALLPCRSEEDRFYVACDKTWLGTLKKSLPSSGAHFIRTLESSCEPKNDKQLSFY